MGPQQTEIISLIECLVSWVVSCFENDLCSMIFDRKWRLLFSLWTETDCVFVNSVCVCVCVPSVRVCYSHCETNYKTLHVTTITRTRTWGNLSEEPQSSHTLIWHLHSFSYVYLWVCVVDLYVFYVTENLVYTSPSSSSHQRKWYWKKESILSQQTLVNPGAARAPSWSLTQCQYFTL